MTAATILLAAESATPGVKTSGHILQGINGYSTNPASIKVGYLDQLGGDYWHRGFIWFDVGAMSDLSRFTLIDSIKYTLTYTKSSQSSSNPGCPSSNLLAGAISVAGYNAWSVASSATRWAALREPVWYTNPWPMPCPNGNGSTSSDMRALALQDLTNLIYSGGRYFGVAFDEYPRSTGGSPFNDSTWIQVQSFELIIRSLLPPTHSGPAGSISTSTPTLSWTANGSVTGLVNSYWRVQISTDSDFFPPTDIVWSSTAPLSYSSLVVPNGTLQSGVNYWWRVIPENPNVPFYVPPATARGFIVGSGAAGPGAFSKSGPSDSATGLSPQVTLSWSPSSNATAYSVCVDNTNDSACDWGAFLDIGNTQNWSVTGLYPAGLAADTTYYWQVKAGNNTVTLDADGGAWHRFTTASPVGPGTFAKTLPASSASGQSPTLTLSWTASAGATSYEVCIDDTDNDTCDMGAFMSVGMVLSWGVAGLYPAGLAHNTNYYWQVRALNNAATTDADGGAWYRFSTASASGPGSFSKATPGDGTIGHSNRPTLTWTASNGATAYSICIDDTDNNSCDMGAYLDVGSGQSWAVTGLYPAGLAYSRTYYWQVRARNGNGTVEGDSGSWYRFTTAPPAAPGAFSKTAPQSASVGLSSFGTQLSWTASDGATFYGVCLQAGINNGGMCDDGLFLKAGSALSWNTSTLYPAGMAYDTTYYWQVRAYDGTSSTNADGDTRFYFTTSAPGPGAFGKSTPTEGVSAQSVASTLTWTPSSGATGYSICIDDTDNDSCDASSFSDVGNALYAPATAAYSSGLAPNKTYYWQVRARNSVGGVTNANDGSWWSFSTLTSPATLAAYDSTLRVPKCATPSMTCDSGSLLSGRDSLVVRSESGQPNNLSGVCADGSGGEYHSDESVERIVISSENGNPLTPGSVARVAVTVWAYSEFHTDRLDLYYAASASRPSWTLLTTLTPAGSGEQTLEATFTLPRGGLQALRAVFRFQGAIGTCPSGAYDEADDLVFAVLADPFTDDSLNPAVTPVRLVHITELRSRIGALRARYELPTYAWTDPVLLAGSAVRAVHLIELRTAISSVYSAAGLSPPAFSDATISAQQSRIKAAHIMELRRALTAIE